MSRSMQRASRDTAEPHVKRKRLLTDDENNSPSKKQSTLPPEQLDYDDSLSKMDAAMLSDHLAKTLRRHADSQSTIELEDQFVPAGVIRDTSSFILPRVSKHLPAFLEAISNGRDELSTCNGVARPHTIIVTQSGIRAANLARAIRTFAVGDVKIAKLFAKHMKLQPTIDFVQKTKISIGVGTPSRLRELLERSAIDPSEIKRIVIDGSYKDEKQRTIFDSKDIFLPLLAMLNLDKIRSRYDMTADKIEIAIF